MEAQTVSRIARRASMVRRKSFEDNPPPEDMAEAMNAVKSLGSIQQAAREVYSQIRSDREKATFAMMMRMNPKALTDIRKEFFIREDELGMEEFVYVIQKHLTAGREPEEKKEFSMKMIELFKDIDVNGDERLEWQEFTTYVVEKANLLNRRFEYTNLQHYYDSSENLDASAFHRHRHDLHCYAAIPRYNQFAVVEEHKNSIFLFNSRWGKLVETIPTDSAPVALMNFHEKDLLVAASADMTLSTYALDNLNMKHVQNAWTTPSVQMSLAYMPDTPILYSGSATGVIHSWNINDRSMVSTIAAHKDIVMTLNVLSKLNNIASGSLDKTVCIWDSCSNAKLLELHGHKKGVFDLSYNPDYRLMFSAGFEPDAIVWSPFVNQPLYRLKGHHQSLVGVKVVEDTPEILTADSGGTFKLWDIRTYQCVQTFTTLSNDMRREKLCSFFHMRLPSRSKEQKEEDSRIYACSKLVYSFDQVRVVHDDTTDISVVSWVGWTGESSFLVTASANTVILWDALIGSKTVIHEDICASEITACALDNRKRKLIIGDVQGNIGLYNTGNGALLKSTSDDDNIRHSSVVSIEYLESSDIEVRRFLAGYMNGEIRLYDEGSLEDCNVVRIFDVSRHRGDLLSICFLPTDSTVISRSTNHVRLWDFNAGKFEMNLNVCDGDEYVSCCICLLPYPLIAVGDSRGNVSVWGSRGTKYPGRRIAGFANATAASAHFESKASTHNPRDESMTVLRAKPPETVAHLGDERRQFYRRHSSTNIMGAAANEIRRSIARKSIDATRRRNSRGSELDGSKDAALAALADEANDVRRASEDEGSMKKDSMSAKRKSNPGSPCGQARDSAAEKRASSPESFTTMKEVPDEMHSVLLIESAQENTRYFAECEEKWGRIMSAQCLAFDASHKVILTGDDLGVIRAFSVDMMIRDLGGEDLSMHRTNIQGLCQHKFRNEFSAPPPLMGSSPDYLLGRKSDFMSYLGVDFNWSINASDDRIVYITCMEYGIVSSAADHLVKVWSFEGLPLGSLLQSIPSGVHSRFWHVEIDAEKIMADEDKEMEHIMEDVEVLTANADKHSIENVDLHLLQPGMEAEFSQSTLRQRIEVTRKKLGIDFPTGLDYFKELSEVNIRKAREDDIQSLVSQSLSKSSKDALMEIKSPNAAADFDPPEMTPTIIQQKRKLAKLKKISQKYSGASGLEIIGEEESEMRLRNTKVAITEAGGDLDQLLDASADAASCASYLADEEGEFPFDNKSSKSRGASPPRTACTGSRAHSRQREQSLLNVGTPYRDPLKQKLLNAGRSAMTPANPTGKPLGERAEKVNTICKNYKSFTELENAMKCGTDDRLCKSALNLARQRNKPEVKEGAIKRIEDIYQKHKAMQSPAQSVSARGSAFEATNK